MMVRIFTILFFGTLFWLAFDFLFYAGLFVNYIEAHSIPIFYNEFFTDSQFWWLWIPGIFLYGTVFLVEKKTKEKVAFYLLSFLIAFIPWIPSFGEQIGRALFSKGSMDYQFKKILVKDATILYSGRGYDYVIVPGRKITLRYPVKRRVKK
ncbi:hypothetical protein [Hydrogenimonas urashimensis]|uniref:hypothetical protein n=1 Tax=Hydrogenimonas urashimensis TaxID=2740515 RepID=UPI001914E2A6|nr:hypothetical protein [Hydrogenimonas urashimensis]